MGYIGVIWGNRKENGNYYSGLYSDTIPIYRIFYPLEGDCKWFCFGPLAVSTLKPAADVVLWHFTPSFCRGESQLVPQVAGLLLRNLN